MTPIWRTNAESEHNTNSDGEEYTYKSLWDISNLIETTVTELDNDNLMVIDGTNLVPHIYSSTAGEESYYSDGLHPNDEGFAEYSTNIIAAIKNALGISE